MPRLTRLVLLLALVTSSVALAHAFVLDFVFNRSVPNFANDAGIVPLQWLDMEEAGGAAVARLRATRRALSPFDRPDANDVLILSDDIPLGSPIDFHDWDARDAGEGCWQPYAILYDVIDGEQLARAHARVTVMHGENVPPSLWVLTPGERQPDDAGRLQLQWELDEPDDSSITQISWVAADGERGLVVGGLPLSPGTRSASYTVDTRRLPPKPVWFHLEMRSGDAGSYCDAWWDGYVGGAFLDGGTMTDGGVSDAGRPDGGDAPVPRGGCGCSTPGGAWALCAALVCACLRSRRRRAQRRME